MKKISGTTIFLTRGDTLKLTVELTNYELQQGDVIRFALKKDYSDTTPLILKNLVDGVLTLEPSDTKSLDFGNYVYDIEITTVDGEVDTFIDEAKFVLKKEVY